MHLKSLRYLLVFFCLFFVFLFCFAYHLLSTYNAPSTILRSPWERWTTQLHFTGEKTYRLGDRRYFLGKDLCQSGPQGNLWSPSWKKRKDGAYLQHTCFHSFSPASLIWPSCWTCVYRQKHIWERLSSGFSKSSIHNNSCGRHPKKLHTVLPFFQMEKLRWGDESETTQEAKPTASREEPWVPDGWVSPQAQLFLPSGSSCNRPHSLRDERVAPFPHHTERCVPCFGEAGGSPSWSVQMILCRVVTGKIEAETKNAREVCQAEARGGSFFSTQGKT